MALDVGGVPMVATGGWDNGGGGWMGMLLLIALLGGRGFGGFGGGWGGWDGGFGRGFNSQAGLGNEVQIGFNDIKREDEFKHLRDGQFGLQRDILETKFANEACCCKTQNHIDHASFQNAILAKDAELRAQACCCETNRNIDALRNEASRNTCDIIQAGKDNTNAILTFLSTTKLEEANAKIAALDAEKNKLEIIAAMKPVAPVPAYFQQNPFENFVPRVHCVDEGKRS